jgi:hypothetical protein
MKFLCWLLMLCLVSNAFAASASTADLSSVFNEYEYALTVEWDQKDKAMEQKITSEFFSKVDGLFKAKGLTAEAVEAFLVERIHDKSKLASIKAQVNLLSFKAESTSELAQLLSQNASSMRLEGANWNGSTLTLQIGALVLLAGLLAYSIYFNLNNYCSKKKEWTDCGWLDTQDCGYDYDGDYHCWDSGSEYVCSDHESCEEYTKR